MKSTQTILMQRSSHQRTAANAHSQSEGEEIIWKGNPYSAGISRRLETKGSLVKFLLLHVSPK